MRGWYSLRREALIFCIIMICLFISLTLSASRAVTAFFRQWRRGWDVERMIREEKKHIMDVEEEKRKAFLEEDLILIEDGEEIFIFEGRKEGEVSGGKYGVRNRKHSGGRGR